MKNVLSIALIVAGSITGRLFAQGHEMGDMEKMSVFSEWVGRWKGESKMQAGPGDTRTSTVEEHIESKLGGMVLLVEGIGKAADPVTRKEITVHHALAVLSYSQQSGGYKFRSYLQDGRSTDAWLKVVGHNKYQWGFESPRGKVRYNISLDPERRSWNEVGEYSQDGNSWTKFFEMNLTKVE